MGKLLLARHVESQYGEGNQERSEGWRDIPPSPEGRKQAKEIGAKFEPLPVKEVIASDLQRNAILGRAIASTTGAPFSSSRGLRSINVGELAGKLRTENKKALEYHRSHPDVKFPGGETFRSYVKRWLTDELPDLQKKAEKLDGYLVAITHSHNIADAYEFLNGKRLKDLPPTGSVWEVDGDSMKPFDFGGSDEDDEDAEGEGDSGIGVPIAEYTTKGPTFCGSCEYQEPIDREFGACKERHVLLAPRAATLPVLDGGKARKVNLAHGCCRWWDDGKDEDE